MICIWSSTISSLLEEWSPLRRSSRLCVKVLSCLSWRSYASYPSGDGSFFFVISFYENLFEKNWDLMLLVRFERGGLLSNRSGVEFVRGDCSPSLLIWRLSIFICKLGSDLFPRGGELSRLLILLLEKIEWIGATSWISLRGVFSMFFTDGWLYLSARMPALFKISWLWYCLCWNELL